MQSVPSHFSTCTNTGDLETLHKPLLTTHRQSLNGLKRANRSGDNTAIYPGDLKCSLRQNLPSLPGQIKALLLPQLHAGTVSTGTSSVPSCTGTKPTERDRALHTGSEQPQCCRVTLSRAAAATPQPLGDTVF